ncbi:HAD family hydrolase [Natronosporangium hydrolyticum]|uniref:HAD family hydrolase n=1 Tax=Natronosporangium hydrolyticum TaxID=2811111 RepID=A0A895Y6B2_9ACTN|nr:HAD family hydrolase [Natronosporangium hydrolyticum]QSB13287.1 HAD family hydrolase [Natronosporangium hydrolyticum]
MTRYRAVLFDFFGTLSHAVTRGPWHDLAARHLGCDPTALLDMLDRTFSVRATGAFGDAESTLRWVCDLLDLHPPAARIQAAVRAKEAAVHADTRLRPDAVDTLAALRARGLRTAVVSDCGYELPRFLPALPIAPLLDTCVYSVEVGRRKPHPRLYQTACRRLGVAPDQCLYVGDGGSQELTGARAAGMTALQLAAPDLHEHLVFDQEASFDGPRIGTLAELLDWFDIPTARPRCPVVSTGDRPAAVTSPP